MKWYHWLILAGLAYVAYLAFSGKIMVQTKKPDTGTPQ